MYRKSPETQNEAPALACGGSEQLYTYTKYASGTYLIVLSFLTNHSGAWW